MSKRKVFIVVGAPRTGTSLLCSILSDVGADFGLSSTSWNRTGGAFEHKLLIDSYKYLKRIKFFKQFSDRMARKMERKLSENLSKLFNEVDYAKFPLLSYMLPYYIKKLGFDVRIILAFRKFEDYAMSMLIKNPGSVKQCSEAYLDMYQTGLVLLNIYGGCAISYDDITEESQTNWASTLAATTGLDSQKLLQARQSRNRKKIENKNIFNLHDHDCTAIFNELVKAKDNPIEQNQSKINKS